MLKTDTTRTTVGFTIVELLVVIVVIGILAALTVVAYTGISQRAVAASLQSDLSNASTRLKMFYVDNGYYPSANVCPSPGATQICLLASPGNIYAYTPAVGVNPQTFTLDALSTNNTKYRLTNNTSPVFVLPAAITGIGAITGTTQVGSTLTAGAVTPGGATVSYQWTSAATAGGSYSNIGGATSSTYLLVSGDLGRYIKVVVTATGDSTGSAMSAASSVVTAVAGINITGCTIDDSEPGYRSNICNLSGSLNVITGGSVVITVKGAGGGGGGGGAQEDYQDGDGGGGGDASVLTYNTTSYTAGGGGGGEGGEGYGGSPGGGGTGGGGPGVGGVGANWASDGAGGYIASGLSGTVGGGSGGGGGGWGSRNNGYPGGAGGRVSGTISVTSGNTITVVVGSGGGGGGGEESGDTGTGGAVTVRYAH